MASRRQFLVGMGAVIGSSACTCLGYDHACRRHVLSSGVIATTFPAPPSGLRLVEASDVELALYGVPPRPDRTLDPRLYELWYDAFSRKTTFISPALRESITVGT